MGNQRITDINNDHQSVETIEVICANTDLQIGQLNVNGWTKANSKLRTELIEKLKCDIIGLSETHLSEKGNYCYPQL